MRIKVVIFKPGLDSHYRGAITVARYLAAQGMEVVYLGNQLAEAAVRAGIEEDADVLGISSLSGNHRTIVPEVLSKLREYDATDMAVVLGGIVPDADRPSLLQDGVDAIFGPGTPLARIATELVRAVQARRDAAPGPTRTTV
jgi:methylmalonyl-CoA mutase C-terminal domain/subunit